MLFRSNVPDVYERGSVFLTNLNLCSINDGSTRVKTIMDRVNWELHGYVINNRS